MIVKVQISISTSEPVRQVLVYNEDRTVQWEGPAPQEVIDLMHGEPKAFFYAHLENGKVCIDEPAEWQDW